MRKAKCRCRECRPKSLVPRWIKNLAKQCQREILRAGVVIIQIVTKSGKTIKRKIREMAHAEIGHLELLRQRYLATSISVA